jgi:phosphoglycerate dehydrogenase-like enzyme
MTDPPPMVVSLTPEAVLGPSHARHAPELAPHRLVYAGRRAGAGETAIGEADYLVGDWTHELALDGAALERARRCRAVFQPTAGTECIDLERAAQLEIPVSNAPGTNDRAVAEWTVMAILALLKDVWRHHQGVQDGRWDMVAAGERGVFELGGRTVGIVGLGRIGQAVARRLSAFELGRLVYADERSAGPELEHTLRIERLDIDELCAVSDAVTLHLPLTPRSRRLIDARRLALLRPRAVLVNAARGAIVDEAALAAALDAGRLKGAALDVFTDEPPPPDHPLRGRPDVLLSPHLAGSTNEARERMIASALANLDRVLRGRDPAHVVNGVRGVPRRPGVWPRSPRA